jgi:hypothetical protein
MDFHDTMVVCFGWFNLPWPSRPRHAYRSRNRGSTYSLTLSLIDIPPVAGVILFESTAPYHPLIRTPYSVIIYESTGRFDFNTYRLAVKPALN